MMSRNDKKNTICIILFLMICLLGCSSLQDKKDEESNNYYGAEYVRNYDGDTVTFDLPKLHPLIGNKIPVRIRGIDTPEIRGKCQQEKELAVKAKLFVTKMLSGADTLDLIDMQRDKYFRIVADILVDGEWLKDVLLKKGLAAPYEGKTKRKDWCK